MCSYLMKVSTYICILTYTNMMQKMTLKAFLAFTLKLVSKDTNSTSRSKEVKGLMKIQKQQPIVRTFYTFMVAKIIG